MRSITLILFLCSLLSSGNAQETTGNRKFLEQVTGKLLYIFQNTDIQGSQFLNDKWVNGKVLLDDNRYLDNLQLKFDVYNNKFILNKRDTAYEITPTIKEIRLYQGPDTTSSLIFRKGFTINDKINGKLYLQVLAEGAITLLKYDRKELEEYSDYGNATKQKRFNSITQYFVFYKGQYKYVSLSKKDLQDVLLDKWPTVSDFLAKNKLNGKNEQSWQDAINYYNSL